MSRWRVIISGEVSYGEVSIPREVWVGGVVSPGVEGPGVGNSLGEGRRNRSGEVVGLGTIYLSVLIMEF